MKAAGASGWELFGYAAGGAAIGVGTGAIGAGVGAAFAVGIGLSATAGTLGGMIAYGAVSGAVGGAVGGFLSGGMMSSLNGGDFMTGAVYGMVQGAAFGGVLGAAGGAYTYYKGLQQLKSVASEMRKANSEYPTLPHSDAPQTNINIKLHTIDEIPTNLSNGNGGGGFHQPSTKGLSVSGGNFGWCKCSK